jgi:hypothetical protein
MRPSDCFAADISKDGVWWWLGTFDSTDKAAHAYNAAAWRFGRPCRDHNFPDVKSMAESEFLKPLMQYVDYDARRQQRRTARQHQLAALDEMCMGSQPASSRSSCRPNSPLTRAKESQDRRRRVVQRRVTAAAATSPVKIEDSDSSLDSDFWDMSDKEYIRFKFHRTI